MSSALLEVRNLTKHFPGRNRGTTVRAVDGIDLDVAEHETLGLVGESGCGKSTAGQSILRLIEPTAGSVRFDGVDVLALSPEELRLQRRHMQIVFQDPSSSLNPRMTVDEIVGEPLLVHGTRDRQTRSQKVAEMLSVVGLARAHARRYPHQFSGGQRQRIGIARALIMRPRLIICDEAVSALDVSVQAQIVTLFQDIQRDFGVSYLFISHNLAVVRQVADRVAVMYLGRIVETAPRDVLYGTPRHPYTRALMSAVPVVRAEERQQRIVLKGDLPDPGQTLPGCPFHPRCPIAVDRCRVERPPLRAVAGGAQVACHLADEAGTGSA